VLQPNINPAGSRLYKHFIDLSNDLQPLLQPTSLALISLASVSKNKKNNNNFVSYKDYNV
jgi:hypothetical protein